MSIMISLVLSDSCSPVRLFNVVSIRLIVMFPDFDIVFL